MAKAINPIAKRLREYLKDKGYTNKEFAMILGVSQSTIANYLNNVSDIQKIFILLHTKAGIDLNWLVTGESNIEPQKKPFLELTKQIAPNGDINLNITIELK